MQLDLSSEVLSVLRRLHCASVATLLKCLTRIIGICCFPNNKISYECSNLQLNLDHLFAYASRLIS